MDNNRNSIYDMSTVEKFKYNTTHIHIPKFFILPKLIIYNTLIVD
ncbi:hypothetical protein CNEO4_200016 [Clostridium neonatale]|uniref:Uncharacterized protein n=1 Tax=Clostridium neonatale TaxID=137838 RepID=A0AA86MSV1_9CLOT|nr:hypothetical protein CNEO_43575 [Clostridium neonatale]CAI3610449.1 hypothetical protein CNEO4_200017 [Clostridium neonatale]CAI3618160.1 hypothetical protein CNEO4_200016 [Clostridium neonatale]CAI3637170.1 hypothetical protein CNEO4_200016 [Clostridium neonatale]CAI3715773.1 hypothetical protein CNEO3_890016 [Clostridium neonatale]